MRNASKGLKAWLLSRTQFVQENAFFPSEGKKGLEHTCMFTLAVSAL